MPVRFVDSTNYSKINKALAKEFGKGLVELRKATGQDYPFTLWFKDDNTTEETINKAKSIVAKFDAVLWLDDQRFHSDD